MLEKESWNWNRRDQDEQTPEELTAFVVLGMSMLALHSLLWVCYRQTDMHQPQSKGTQLSNTRSGWYWATDACLNSEISKHCSGYISTTSTFNTCRVQIFFQKVSLLIAVCGSPFPSLATLVQTLCINLSSVLDLISFVWCSWDSFIFFERHQVIFWADLASQSMTTPVMC